jgi:hypothetical protein
MIGCVIYIYILCIYYYGFIKTIYIYKQPLLWFVYTNHNHIYIYGWCFGTWIMFPDIGNVIIPTDGLIFFRGVGIPPTRYIMIYMISWNEMISTGPYQAYQPSHDHYVNLIYSLVI